MKQVIAVRTDIKMGKGKLAAQTAHASLSAAEEAMKRREAWFREWKGQGQPKIVVKVGSEEELRALERAARAQRLPCALIEDAGLTQLDPGTATALGVGPGPEEQLDKVTGKLKLL